MSKEEYMQQSDKSFRDANDLIIGFLTKRGWLKDEKGSRSLAISLALEASELLEHYQWHDKPIGSKDEVASELADVFIYGFQFAYANNIDIFDAITKKLEKQSKKYPVDVFNPNNKNDSGAWLKAKIAYSKKKDTL